jgi:uncharacterized protein (TIGR03067 family)
MKYALVAMAALCLVVVAECPIMAEPISDDWDALEGVWKATEATPNPDGTSPVKYLVFFAKTFSLVGTSSASRAVKLSLNPYASPKEITLHGPERSLQGIYEITGEHLRLCLDISGTGRPSEFAVPAGSDWCLDEAVRVVDAAEVSSVLARAQNADRPTIEAEHVAATADIKAQGVAALPRRELPSGFAGDWGVLALTLCVTFVVFGIIASALLIAATVRTRPRLPNLVIAWAGYGLAYLVMCLLLLGVGLSLLGDASVDAGALVRRLGDGMSLPFAGVILWLTTRHMKFQLQECVTRLVGPLLLAALSLLVAVIGAAMAGPRLGFLLVGRNASVFSIVATDFGVGCVAYGFLLSCAAVILAFIRGLVKRARLGPPPVV